MLALAVTGIALPNCVVSPTKDPLSNFGTSIELPPVVIVWQPPCSVTRQDLAIALLFCNLSSGPGG